MSRRVLLFSLSGMSGRVLGGCCCRARGGRGGRVRRCGLCLWLVCICLRVSVIRTMGLHLGMRVALLAIVHRIRVGRHWGVSCRGVAGKCVGRICLEW